MRKRALELMPPVAKVEKLLGHNLAITEEILLDSVEKAVSQRQEELGLLNLTLDYSKVDWNRVALDAVYRRPPFQDGEKEKGFRDCMIVECFLQLVADSPKTPEVCRVVLVTGDKLVSRAILDRNTGWTNTTVLSSLEELKGLINTLVSQVDEAFLAQLKPKASNLFFIPKDESTLFYREHIKDRINALFQAELTALPSGATSRTNGTWRISPPNFVKKNGRRIQWASRISVEAEASKTVTQPPALDPGMVNATPNLNTWAINPTPLKIKLSDLMSPQNIELGSSPTLGTINLRPTFLDFYAGTGTESRITTHTGSDVYEVLWSADVTTSRDLRRPLVDELKHLEPVWEQVT